MTDLTEKNYYLLELDDAVIALENKDAEIEKLKEENAQLKKWCEEFNALDVKQENEKLKTENKWHSEQLNEAVKEIDKLKEEVSTETYKVSEAYCFVEELKDLLKECVHYVVYICMETRENLTKPYTASDKALHKKAEKLLTKIDEVLE